MKKSEEKNVEITTSIKPVIKMETTRAIFMIYKDSKTTELKERVNEICEIASNVRLDYVFSGFSVEERTAIVKKIESTKNFKLSYVREDYKTFTVTYSEN